MKNVLMAIAGTTLLLNAGWGWLDYSAHPDPWNACHVPLVGVWAVVLMILGIPVGGLLLLAALSSAAESEQVEEDIGP